MENSILVIASSEVAYQTSQTFLLAEKKKKRKVKKFSDKKQSFPEQKNWKSKVWPFAVDPVR